MDVNRNPPLILRQPPPFKVRYHWRLQGAGVIIGRPTAITSSSSVAVTLLQGDDGLHCFFSGSIPELDLDGSTDRRTVKHAMRTWGLVFEAHPQLQWFPWSVPDATPNRHVLRALGVQAFQSCKKVFARPLLAFVDRLEAKADNDR